MEDVLDDGMNLLLDEGVLHILDKGNCACKEEAVFLDQNKRLSTSTTAPDFPSKSIDTLNFVSSRQLQIPTTRDKAIVYHQNFSERYL